MAALSKISSPKKKREQKIKIKHTKPREQKSGELKPFQFVAGETKYLGPEPSWEIQPEQRVRCSALARAFTWYSYFFQNKEAKPMLLQWCELKHTAESAKSLKSVSESEFSLTICWLARMNLMGLELQDSELAKINEHINHLLTLRTTITETTTKRPGIQDHIRKKTLDIAGEIEGAYDDWVKTGLKSSPPVAIDIMRSQNLLAQHVAIIQEPWVRELAELKATATDKSVAECYDYTRTQIKAMIKFCESVIADCASYVQVKRVERKPRAKKAKPPAQIVRKFRFLKESPELNLKSESPEKLVACQEAWFFDVKRRKLIHAVADLNAGSMTVSGMTLVGFGERDTVMKTIRKPEEIKGFLREGKPGMRKWFKEVKTTEAKWNGRSNEHLILLKAW